MFYVGLDIHTKRIAICALNETGQVVHRAQVRSLEEMLRLLRGFPDRFEVCYEASCGYGHFHDPAAPAGRTGPGGASGSVAVDLPFLCGVAAYVTTRRSLSRIRTLPAG
jgi:hypothetical protein